MSNKVTVNCGWCGEELVRRKDKLEQSKSGEAFCGTACVNKWRGGEPKELTCEYCEEKYILNAAKAETSKYCSKECKDSDAVVDKVKVTCETCGELDEIYPSRATGDRYFCSRNCYGEAITGEDNHVWVDSIIGSYRGSWERVATKMREKVGGVCEHPTCDKTRTEDGKNLHVHHIVPARLGIEQGYFNSWEEANAEDNLLVVCQEHHTGTNGVEPAPRTKKPVEVN